MKATSLFGGVQVFNILFGIIRSKIIAVLLGPAGMGIAGLLNSSTGMIGSITNFGLSTSAVKNVAEANATGNNQRIATVISVIGRLVWITGILGTLITFVLAQALSKLAFGNPDYTVAFRWVSIILLLGQLSAGKMVVLQGMRKLQYLAKANMAASVIGLLVSIPIYYKLGVKGIVPAIIITSIIGLAIVYFYSSKIAIEKTAVTTAVLKTEGAGMLRMGFLLSLSGLIGLGAAYLLGVFISRQGGVEQVGLYNAGFAIINTYVGLIFAAMATDYYPRLSAVSNNNKKAAELINQQAEIGILILAPVLILFMVFINTAVLILYSSKFVAINGMIQLVALGLFLKAVTWAMGFMMLAKGNSKVFFYSELVANIYTLALNMLFYKFFGLNGIGISFLVCYSLGVLQTYAIIHWKYEFLFEPAFYKIFLIQFLLAVTCFVLVKYTEGTLKYMITFPVIIAASVFSLHELNKKLDIVSLVRSKFKNKK